MIRKRFIRGFKSLPFNPDLKRFARQLRNNSTLGEVKFWSEILSKKKSGYQFYRQKMILNYIVDFYCSKLKLVIEIDGTSHDAKIKYDKRREQDLEALGLKIVRYNDLTIVNNFESVEREFVKMMSDRCMELNVKKSPLDKGETDL